MLADFVTGTGSDTGKERDRLQLGLVQPDVGACLSSNVAHGEFVKNLTRWGNIFSRAFSRPQ